MEPTNPSQSTNPTDGPAPTGSVPPTVDNFAPEQPSAPTQSAPEVMSTPQVTTPVVSGSPVVGGGVQQSPVFTASPGGSGGPGRKKKWLIPALAGGALTVLLAAGYVFGLYLPNKPEAVFSKSLTQSGKALDKLIEYVQEEAKSPSPSFVVNGTINVKSPDVSFDITTKGNMSDKEADLTMDANIVGQKLKADFRMIDAEGSDNPDMYIKLDGAADMLQGLGAQPSQAATVEDKWIAIDHTLLDSVASQAAGASLKTNPTTEQMQDALAKVQVVNKEYLFTDNSTKGVVQYKSFEGKSTADGRDVMQYKATYSKTNMKAYVKAVGKALDESKLNDWYKNQSDESFSQSMQLKELEKSIDDAKDDYVFDVYVDEQTKLIHSLVFSDPDDDKTRLTIYQNYTEGSVYPVGIKFTTDTSGQTGSFDLGMSVDTKTDITNFDVNVEVGSEGSTATITGKFTFTPSKDDLTVEMPAGSTPITTVMNQLGFSGDSVLGAFTDSTNSL
ncbi:hypothetical protein IPL85_06100 [Candidatus Saccharibacteria bacterium]|nr:MAG: hypothetical protein IPL85_06100 [Candidatus Saccharibacteria bacterium]